MPTSQTEKEKAARASLARGWSGWRALAAGVLLAASASAVALADGYSLSPSQPPGRNFDLSHWYLGTPDAGQSLSIPASDLMAGYTNAWFFTGPDGAMVFWAPVTGGTTPNSSYPRSELREQINPPDNSINWTAFGAHVLDAQCKVTRLPSTGKVIIGQIHGYLGAARPLLKFVFTGGAIDAQVKQSPSSDTDLHVAFPNVPFNSLITYRIVVQDGLLVMTINGVTQSVDIFRSDPGWADQTFYFKAGSYCQDNSGPSTEGAQVEFYQLASAHGTFAPVPPSITRPPVSTAVPLGSNVVLSVSADGGLPLDYRWLKDGVPIAVPNNSILPIYNAQLSDGGLYHAVVSNAWGVVTSAVVVLTVRTNFDPIPLPEALDTTTLVWTTAGSPSWEGHYSISHDGLDAARSGSIADGATSSLQTTVNGPGILTFWWKVSSETNADYLILSFNSSEQARISGGRDWEQRTFNVPAGSQVLKWSYTKNGSAFSGQDRGWVDQVQFLPLPAAITNQPLARSVDAGATVTFIVGVSGTPPLSYQWQWNGNPLSDGGLVRGAATATLTLSNVQPAQSGEYSVLVSNAVGGVTSSNALLTVSPVIALAEGLDGTNLIWTTNGTAPWTGQNLVTHDGTDAARSGLTADGATTSFQTTVNGPGLLTFWWRVSSETNADYLILYFNSAEQARISGGGDWTQRTFNVPAGSQVLKWSYTKNGSASAGQDRGWVDEVQFLPLPVLITNQPVARGVEAGATVTFSVGAAGTPPLSYQWLRNGSLLSDGGTVRGATTATLTLSNVQPAQSGNYSVLVLNAAGGASSSNALLTVSPIIALADALDGTNLVWTTNGTPPWAGQNLVTHDGTDAARSGAIGDGTTTYMQTSVNGPGTITFWWKVSSQTNSDVLLFSVGGTERARLSGEMDWRRTNFSLAAGSQLLRWTYSKNGSTVAGLDRAWVDQVSYERLPVPVAPGNLSAKPTTISRIDLAWTDASTNESAFLVERSTNGTTFTQIASLGSNVTAYANTGLLAGATYQYRVRATNAAGASAYSAPIIAGSTLPFTSARINFQPASAPVPPGYAVDGGLVYGDRGNGLIYGWNSSRTSSATDRNSSRSADQRYDTFITTSSSSRWELAVPNGDYNVFLVAGDAGASSGTYRYGVEGIQVVNGVATTSNRWVSGRANVPVADGRLTLTNVPGVSSVPLCFIDVVKIVPLLTCQPNKIVECGSVWDFNPPAMANDPCSGSISALVVAGTITNAAGSCGFTATRTWRAVDGCGNTNTCSQTVTVVDTTPPALACAINKTAEFGSTWGFDAPTVPRDDCSGSDVTIATVSTITNHAGFCEGSFAVTRTWSATDACGNSNTCAQTVIVLDTTGPPLTCLPDKLAEACTDWIFDAPAAPTDLGNGTNVTLAVLSTTTNRTGFCEGAFAVTRTWSATDACGNSNTCAQTVTVLDTMAPTILCADILTCDPAVAVTPVVRDSADPAPQLSCLRSDGLTLAAAFPVGATTVTCGAVDACGNSATCQFTVTVQAPLDGPGPADQTVLAGSDVLFATTVAGSSPLSYVWKFNGGVIPGATTASFVLENVSPAAAGTYCVEVTGPCNLATACSTLTVLDLHIERCTLTQDFYADTNRLFGGVPTLDLLTNLLSAEPLVIGKLGVRSVTLGIEDVMALTARLPAGGPAAALADVGDQLFAALPLNAQERLDNALLGQTIALALNCRLDPGLTSFVPAALICTRGNDGVRSFGIPGSVLDSLISPALGLNDPTVAGLLELANRRLAGLLTEGATLGEIQQAVAALNAAFDGCRTLVTCNPLTLPAVLPP